MSRGLSKQQWDELKRLARWGSYHVGLGDDAYSGHDDDSSDAFERVSPGTKHSRLNNLKRGLKSLERRGLVKLELERKHRDPWPNPVSGIQVRDRTKATITKAGAALVAEHYPEIVRRVPP